MCTLQSFADHETLSISHYIDWCLTIDVEEVSTILVCMCVRTYVCTYKLTYFGMYVRVYVRTCVRIHLWVGYFVCFVPSIVFSFVRQFLRPSAPLFVCLFVNLSLSLHNPFTLSGITIRWRRYVLIQGSQPLRNQTCHCSDVSVQTYVKK